MKKHKGPKRNDKEETDKIRKREEKKYEKENFQYT